jgi:hypothetical protein
VTISWAARLPMSHAETLAACRMIPDVEVGSDGGVLWLRGRALAPDDERRLRSLPDVTRYSFTPGRELVEEGRHLSSGRLPPVEWSPISSWVVPVLPIAKFAGTRFQRCSLALVRSGVERPANVVMTSLDVWKAHGEFLPQIRLQCWRFALCSDSRVVIWGAPPPSLPGARYCEAAGLAVPVGWTWAPHIPAAAFAISRGDLVLWQETGVHERIAHAHWAAATRSAIRLSGREGGRVAT